jgi:hypothetical protein
MSTIIEKDLQFEYDRIATLDESEIERVSEALDKKAEYDPATAERRRIELKEMSLELANAHAEFLTAGRLYHTAKYWTREYQIIVSGYMRSKALHKWAVEWLKVALDLGLLVVTLGATNLYRAVIPKMMSRNFVVQGVVRQSAVRTFITGVPRTGIVEGSKLLFRTGVWPLNKLRSGMICKAVFYSIPMAGAKQLTKWAIPLVLADSQGVTDDEYEGHMKAERMKLLQELPKPTRTLISFNEAQLLLFLAKTEEQIHLTIRKNPQIMALDEMDRNMIKATAMMDTWLQVSNQSRDVFMRAWNNIVKLESDIREMQRSTWHENWQHSSK